MILLPVFKKKKKKERKTGVFYLRKKNRCILFTDMRAAHVQISSENKVIQIL